MSVLFFVPFVPLAVYGILGIYVCFVYTYGWKFGSLGSLGVVGLDILYSVCCSDIRTGCGWVWGGGGCCILVSRPLGDVWPTPTSEVGGFFLILYCRIRG